MCIPGKSTIEIRTEAGTLQLTRWRIERAGGPGQSIPNGARYGRGWFAFSGRDTGAWFATWAEALTFVGGQLDAERERLGLDARHAIAELERASARRAGARRLREIARLIAPHRTTSTLDLSA